MLEDAVGIRRVVLACGTVDLRKGIDGLATIIGDKYGQNPFEKGTLFLFCGKRSDRCKGLLWMGTGFLLLYKRFEAGRLSWPRNTQEAAELTEEQYKYLMMGLNPLDPKIKDVDPKNIYWKQWKKIKTKYRMLKAQGMEHWKAKELANSRKGYWRMAKVLNQIFSNKIIVKLGYTSMLDYYLRVCEN